MLAPAPTPWAAHRDRLVREWDLTAHTAEHAAFLMHRYPGLVVTSGRRTALRNRQVGGSPTSWHLRGRAVDFVGPLAVLVEAAGGARRMRVGLSCTGPEEVLLEKAGKRGQHLHVAW